MSSYKFGYNKNQNAGYPEAAQHNTQSDPTFHMLRSNEAVEKPAYASGILPTCV